MVQRMVGRRCRLDPPHGLRSQVDQHAACSARDRKVELELSRVLALLLRAWCNVALPVDHHASKISIHSDGVCPAGQGVLDITVEDGAENGSLRNEVAATCPPARAAR